MNGNHRWEMAKMKSKQKPTRHYRIRKGAKLYPFTYREDKRSDYGWSTKNRYEGKQLYAQEDWYFSSDDLLPIGVQGVTSYYVKLPKMSKIGNAFTVNEKDVTELSTPILPDDDDPNANDFDMWGNKLVV